MGWGRMFTLLAYLPFPPHLIIYEVSPNKILKDWKLVEFLTKGERNVRNVSLFVSSDFYEVCYEKRTDRAETEWNVQSVTEWWPLTERHKPSPVPRSSLFLWRAGKCITAFLQQEWVKLSPQGRAVWWLKLSGRDSSPRRRSPACSLGLSIPLSRGPMGFSAGLQ